ncbi:hypothetical protein, partial [Nocardia wallacei]|uniref:hypothetical protein n=1 Tax=Nocardia wallacei TaxID=480035 RepID=UPI0024547A7E
LELVTFDNGYQAVRETYGDIDSAAREWLHSMMGAAMGAPGGVGPPAPPPPPHFDTSPSRDRGQP